MTDIIAIVALVWLHFIADFILQSDKVSRAKSSDNSVLFYHVSLYGIPFIPFAAWYFEAWPVALLFIFGNEAAHFVTDYFTSRATTKLWKAGEIHWFFVVIGFDQAIHMTTLILTYKWLA